MQVSSIRPWRLGMLVPSSNTVLEPATARLLPPDGSVTTHVSRLRVTQISAGDQSNGQFEAAAFVTAARLLADAHVDLILWNGTAASWLGFDWDASIVDAIERNTGIRATTAVIAINQDLGAIGAKTIGAKTIGAKTIGLVSPYLAAIESKIIANYAAIGIAVTAAERLDLTVNADFAAVPPQRIEAMARAVAASRPDAIVILCTNMAGASLAEPLSRELGIPVIDSVRAAIDHSCRLLRAMRPSRLASL